MKRFELEMRHSVEVTSLRVRRERLEMRNECTVLTAHLPSSGHTKQTDQLAKLLLVARTEQDRQHQAPAIRGADIRLVTLHSTEEKCRDTNTNWQFGYASKYWNFLYYQNVL